LGVQRGHGLRRGFHRRYGREHHWQSGSQWRLLAGAPIAGMRATAARSDAAQLIGRLVKKNG